MSYSVGLSGPEDCNCACCRVRRADLSNDSVNCTFNCAPMFAKAGISIRDLHGMLAADALPRLTAAISAMTADKPAFEKLNPANGWGNYDGALEFLRKIRESCEVAPMGRLWVSA